MAKFQTGTLGVSEICLDSSPKPDGTQRSISLQLTGWNTQPDIKVGSFLRLVAVTHDAASKRSTFRIEAVRDASGVGYVFDNANDGDLVLRVTVGKVTNFRGWKYDLLADLLGRSEDPIKLIAYTRILSKDNNLVGNWEEWDKLLKDQPLKQITDPDHPNRWNCGAAASQFGFNFFGRSHFTAGSQRYYKPFVPRGKINKVDDILFDVHKLVDGVTKIIQLLAQKTAVEVFMAHNDGFTVSNGVIQQSGNTHFVTIVGCDEFGSKFLVTDPWPGGSRCTYTSGIFGNVDSAFMGTLENFGDIVKTPSGSLGVHKYILLTGP
jgi:hypothetical protein